jgi:uncharacterized protein YeaO (DUF488 family)
MSLFTKSIYSQKEKSDGIWIAVLSRYTLDDGVTPDLRMNSSSVDEHWIELAPRPILVGDYKKRRIIAWDIFADRYLRLIREPELVPKVKKLAFRALYEDITILCVEDKEDPHCHRKILALECQRYEQQLRVIHK